MLQLEFRLQDDTPQASELPHAKRARVHPASPTRSRGGSNDGALRLDILVGLYVGTRANFHNDKNHDFLSV
jgi:hypothetical protein